MNIITSSQIIITSSPNSLIPTKSTKSEFVSYLKVIANYKFKTDFNKLYLLGNELLHHLIVWCQQNQQRVNLDLT